MFETSLDTSVLVGRFWLERRLRDENARTVSELEKLRAAGILTFREKGTTTPKVPALAEYFTVLTPRGAEDAKSWNISQKVRVPPQNYTVYSMKIAQRRLDEITGITEDQNRRVIAEFTWEWSATADGNIVLDLIPRGQRKAQAAFKMYDDGWRLMSVEL